MNSRFLRPLLLLVLCLADGVQAGTSVNVDVDLRDDAPRITRFRRIRRFGWHSGTHYGPFVDGNGIWRVGWHTGSHQDWYTIDVPVLDKVDESGWEMFVKFGKDSSLRIRGDVDREVRQTATVAAPGGTPLRWLTPDGNVIAGGPATPERKRFAGNGWEGFDLGDSIIMMDLPGPSGVQVYLKRRTRDLDNDRKTGKPEEPAGLEKRREQARLEHERDKLLDEGDRQFVLGLYPQAALLHQKAMKLDQTDAIARFAVAHCLFALGLYGTAGQNIRLALDKFPDWPQVPLDLPKFYKEERLFFEKLFSLKRFVLDHPADRDARLLLGYCCFFSRDIDAALEHFKELARLPGGDKHAELFIRFIEHGPSEAKKQP